MARWKSKLFGFIYHYFCLIFPEYHFSEGRAIFDGSQGAALVLYPPDKRCAGDAGRPAPDNWGINSSGLSCKELSHRPTKISIPMRNTLSKDRFLDLRLFHSIIYNCDKYFRTQFKLTNSSCADKATLILFGQFSSLQYLKPHSKCDGSRTIFATQKLYYQSK